MWRTSWLPKFGLIKIQSNRNQAEESEEGNYFVCKLEEYIAAAKTTRSDQLAGEYKSCLLTIWKAKCGIVELKKVGFFISKYENSVDSLCYHAEYVYINFDGFLFWLFRQSCAIFFVINKSSRMRDLKIGIIMAEINQQKHLYLYSWKNKLIKVTESSIYVYNPHIVFRKNMIWKCTSLNLNVFSVRRTITT